MMVIIMESLWFQVPALLGVGLTVLALGWELLAFMLRFLLAADKHNAPLKFKVPYIFDDKDDRAVFVWVFVLGGVLGGFLLHFIQWALLLAPFKIGLVIVIITIVLSIRFLFGTMYDHNDRIGNTEDALEIKNIKNKKAANKGEGTSLISTRELNGSYYAGDITTEEYNILKKRAI
jgi:hypothetical protein